MLYVVIDIGGPYGERLCLHESACGVLVCYIDWFATYFVCVYAVQGPSV
jgi:hypothetical protein